VAHYFGQFFESYKVSPHYCATFSRGEGCELNKTKNWLGYILGEFFKNSSGRPA
jgi:hypothetical protein